MGGAFGADAGEEGGGGFVGAVFAAGEFGFGGDEFAAEGFGEDGLGQLLGAGCGRRDPPLDRVGQLEQGLDAADDFVLLGERRQWHRQCFQLLKIQGGPCDFSGIELHPSDRGTGLKPPKHVLCRDLSNRNLCDGAGNVEPPAGLRRDGRHSDVRTYHSDE